MNEAKGKERETQKNEQKLPFQGEKQCFCKKTKQNKRKEGFRANCPKTNVHGCVDPKPKKKTQKRVKHESSRKRCRKKSPEKLGKTLRTTAARPFVATGPTRTQNATHPRAKKFTNWSSPGKNGKKVIFKTTSALQPQAVFCLPNPIWSKNRTFEKKKKKNCEIRKNYSPKDCAESRRCNASKAS